jgi:glycerate dehydrogenase
MMKIKIAILDGIGVNPGDLSWNELKKFGDLAIYETTPYEKIIERAVDAEVVIINKCNFDENIISKLPELRYIIESATGYDNIDIASANRHNIPVSNVSNYSTESVVQHVFSLIFALINRPEHYSRQVFSGKWADNDFFTFWDSAIYELSEKTIGIYGFGKIGSRVAQVAQAFGMKVLAHRKNPERGYTAGVQHADFDILLRESDILTLHAPLTSENLGLINMRNLKKMKSSALLINTARGKMINEKDLCEALENGIIAGAGLDVLSNEPPDHRNPLLKAKNCIITPHQAWTSIEARKKLLAGIVDNLQGYIDGELINLVS